MAIARTTDPQTSQQGAKAIKSFRPKIADLVCRWIRIYAATEAEAATAEEIAVGAWEKYADGKGKTDSYRKRVKESCDAGRIRKSETTRRCKITGQNASIYFFE